MTDLPQVRADRIPVTDTYHGVEVTEDYRWLEDASSAETIAWTMAQQQRTRAYFDRIPWRDALRARVEHRLGYRVLAPACSPQRDRPSVIAPAWSPQGDRFDSGGAISGGIR